MLRKLALLGIGIAAGAAIAGALRSRATRRDDEVGANGHAGGDSLEQRIAAVRDRLAVNGSQN
ncbi:MAG: hypothetical protein R3C15_02845 [Thermoleophilia bacterium]